MHEAEQCSHVVISAGRQDELLDDEQGMFPTLTILHDVVNTTSTAKLPEQSCKTDKNSNNLVFAHGQHNDIRL